MNLGKVSKEWSAEEHNTEQREFSRVETEAKSGKSKFLGAPNISLVLSSNPKDEMQNQRKGVASISVKSNRLNNYRVLGEYPSMYTLSAPCF